MKRQASPYEIWDEVKFFERTNTGLMDALRKSLGQRYAVNAAIDPNNRDFLAFHVSHSDGTRMSENEKRYILTTAHDLSKSLAKRNREQLEGILGYGGPDTPLF